MTGKIAAKVALRMVKTLLISGIFIGACIVVMQFNMTIGIILMMLYSSFMVINSSRKEMPLNKFTALLPGVMSIITFLIMLGLIGLKDPIMPIIGVGIGVVVGFLMARGHKVYRKNGVVYAKRTFFYILIWALSMLFTQGSRLAGVPEITDFGFLLNGFSTAMMVVLSVFLFMKASGGSRRLSGSGRVSAIIILATLLIAGSAVFHTAFAVTFSTKDQNLLTQKVGKYLFSDQLINSFNHGGKSPEIRKDKGHYVIILKNETKVKNERRTNSSPEFHTLSSKVRLSLGNGYFYPAKFKAYKKRSSIKNLKLARDAMCPFGNKFSKPIINGIIVNKCVEGFPSIADIDYGFTIDNWTFSISVSDYIGETGNRFGVTSGDPYRYADDTVSHVIARFNNINFSDSSAHPPTPPGAPSGPPTWPNQHSDFDFSDDEAAAGALLAILMLLTGVGMNAAASAAMSGAMTVAQEAANAAAMAGQDTASSSEDGDDNNWGHDSRTHSNGTLMLDGDEAIAWMKDKKNGYLDGNGNKTDKFEKFMASMPSQSGPGLQGIAQGVDKDGNPTYVIIVPDETPRENFQADDSSDTDEHPEASRDDEQDKYTDSSSSDSDDETTTKPDPSDTKATENNTTGTTDDCDEDQKDTPDTSNQDDKDKKTEIKTSKPAPPDQQTAPIEYPNAKEDLEKIMNENIKQKSDEKYYVINPNLTSKAWNKTLGWFINEGIGDYKGGQCGDYAKWGKDWSSEDIKKHFGKDVYITKILARESITSRTKDALSGYYIEFNHAATKVVLPNGDKYILDYWEGMQNKKPAVYKEKDWINKQRDDLNHFSYGVVIEYEPDNHDLDHLDLYNQMQSRGEEKGKEWFLKTTKNKVKATSIIEAWEKDPVRFQRNLADSVE